MSEEELCDMQLHIWEEDGGMVYIDKEQEALDQAIDPDLYMLDKFQKLWPEYKSHVDKAVQEGVVEVNFLNQPFIELHGAMVLGEELAKMAEQIVNACEKVSDKCLTMNR